jgi:hypothetical protein
MPEVHFWGCLVEYTCLNMCPLFITLMRLSAQPQQKIATTKNYWLWENHVLQYIKTCSFRGIPRGTAVSMLLALFAMTLIFRDFK